MVLGHLTVTSAGRRLAQQRFPRLFVPLGPLLLGAYLPDLVDKPVSILFAVPGRAFGHSLIAEGVVFGFAALALPTWRRVLGPVALGVALHLIEDWVPAVVLFSPFLGPIPPAPRWNFVESFVYFYSSGGPQVWVEVAATLYWIAVAMKRPTIAAT
jgi:hypothetical protein